MDVCWILYFAGINVQIGWKGPSGQNGHPCPNRLERPLGLKRTSRSKSAGPGRSPRQCSRTAWLSHDGTITTRICTWGAPKNPNLSHFVLFGIRGSENCCTHQTSEIIISGTESLRWLQGWIGDGIN